MDRETENILRERGELHSCRECNRLRAENERLRPIEAAARVVVSNYDLNDCDERPDDDALEIPLYELRRLKWALALPHEQNERVREPAFVTDKQRALVAGRRSEQNEYTAGNGEELPKGAAGTTIVNDGRPT